MSTNNNLKYQIDGIEANNKPPEDWSTTHLCEVADIRFSNVDKHSRPGESPILLCNYLDVYNNNYIDRTHEFMAASASNSEMNSFKLNYGDVILTKDSETPDDIGVPAVVLEDIPYLVCGYHLALLKPYQTKVDPVFLAKQFETYRIIRYFSRVATGTTRHGLGNQAVKNTIIWLPPLREQKKIAEILTTVERQIEKTKALIAKYEVVKEGMMADLFTRGLNENGYLRRPLNENHEQYIHTQLGTLPSDWKVTPIYSMAEVVRGGSPRPKGDPRYYGGEVPRLMVEDVTRDCMWVTPKIDSLTQLGATLSRHMPAGTLTLVCSGTVGIPSILATDACIHDGFLALENVSPEVDVKYLYWWFVYAKDQMDAAATHGGIFTNLTTGIVKEIPVPIPDLAEQNKIANILSIQESLIQSEYILFKKLQAFKKGLMQDLLTGKVRVNLDEAEEAVANA